MMKSKKMLALALILVLVVAIFAACGNNQPAAPASAAPADGAATPAAPPADPGATHHFNVSFTFAEPMNRGITEGLDRIVERSNGRITMTHYHSWSLSTVPTIIDDINAGFVSMGVIPVTEHLNRLPNTSTATYIPMLGFPHMLDIGPMFDDLFNNLDTIFSEEFARNDLVYFFNISMPPYHLWLTGDHEVRTPDDLAGLRIVTSCRILQQFLTQHGAAPVTMPVTDYAVSMSTGVIDGAIMHINTMRSFGALDFTESATIFADAGLTTAAHVMAIDRLLWDQLDAELQQLFIDESAIIRDAQNRNLYQLAADNMEWFEESGANITMLSTSELEAWRVGVHAAIEEELNNRVNDGFVHVFEVYEEITRRIAER